ncbi:MAG: HEPN domain-containing protein [candidate division NC10 bacterium]|nr:HEPN domain-containing protein [candidate division NC10 bacterium]
MHEPRDIAKAFLIEGEVDYKIAKLLSGSDFHSRTIYFAQQAVEKLVKACLALKGIFATDHNLASLFKAIYGGTFNDVEALARAIDTLERHGARVRFPLFNRPDLPIWIPSKGYTEEDATRALKGCEFVFRALKAYLDKELT